MNDFLVMLLKNFSQGKNIKYYARKHFLLFFFLWRKVRINSLENLFVYKLIYTWILIVLFVDFKSIAQSQYDQFH